MISNPLPKGTQVNLRRRDWGIERAYTTPKGNEICTPAPYEKSTMTIRKFKITTTDLIDLGYLGNARRLATSSNPSFKSTAFTTSN